MRTETIVSDSQLTSYEVAELLQVNPGSVNKWINAGMIQAFRTPGGHHRIKAGDLVRFLRRQRMPVPKPLSRAGLRRLLVVDDDQAELRVIQRLLKSHAHEVELLLVDKGIDALVQFGFFDPHAVLLDVIMPGLDGVEACRRLKAMEETRTVRVVIVSAALTPEIERDAMAAGADRCLNKPVELKQLLEVLELEASVGASPVSAAIP